MPKCAVEDLDKFKKLLDDVKLGRYDHEKQILSQRIDWFMSHSHQESKTELLPSYLPGINDDTLKWAYHVPKSFEARQTVCEACSRSQKGRRGHAIIRNVTMRQSHKEDRVDKSRSRKTPFYTDTVKSARCEEPSSKDIKKLNKEYSTKRRKRHSTRKLTTNAELADEPSLKHPPHIHAKNLNLHVPPKKLVCVKNPSINISCENNNLKNSCIPRSRDIRIGGRGEIESIFGPSVSTVTHRNESRHVISSHLQDDGFNVQFKREKGHLSSFGNRDISSSNHKFPFYTDTFTADVRVNGYSKDRKSEPTPRNLVTVEKVDKGAPSNFTWQASKGFINTENSSIYVGAKTSDGTGSRQREDLLSSRSLVRETQSVINVESDSVVYDEIVSKVIERMEEKLLNLVSARLNSECNEFRDTRYLENETDNETYVLPVKLATAIKTPDSSDEESSNYSSQEDVGTPSLSDSGQHKSGFPVPISCSQYSAQPASIADLRQGRTDDHSHKNWFLGSETGAFDKVYHSNTQKGGKDVDGTKSFDKDSKANLRRAVSLDSLNFGSFDFYANTGQIRVEYLITPDHSSERDERSEYARDIRTPSFSNSDEELHGEEKVSKSNEKVLSGGKEQFPEEALRGVGEIDSQGNEGSRIDEHMNDSDDVENTSTNNKKLPPKEIDAGYNYIVVDSKDCLNIDVSSENEKGLDPQSARSSELTGEIIEYGASNSETDLESQNTLSVVHASEEDLGSSGECPHSSEECIDLPINSSETKLRDRDVEDNQHIHAVNSTELNVGEATRPNLPTVEFGELSISDGEIEFDAFVSSNIQHPYNIHFKIRTDNILGASANNSNQKDSITQTGTTEDLNLQPLTVFNHTNSLENCEEVSDDSSSESPTDVRSLVMHSPVWKKDDCLKYFTLDNQETSAAANEFYHFKPIGINDGLESKDTPKTLMSGNSAIPGVTDDNVFVDENELSDTLSLGELPLPETGLTVGSEVKPNPSARMSYLKMNNEESIDHCRMGDFAANCDELDLQLFPDVGDQVCQSQWRQGHPCLTKQSYMHLGKGRTLVSSVINSADPSEKQETRQLAADSAQSVEDVSFQRKSIPPNLLKLFRENQLLRKRLATFTGKFCREFS